MMVVPGLAGALANWNAPRKLQSFPAAVQAEAAVKPAPDGSSVRSTVMVVFGGVGMILGVASPELSTTISITPLSFCGRGNTANGSLVASRATLTKSLEIESASSGARSLGPIGCSISSFDWSSPITIRSSISRRERWVRSNGLNEAELTLFAVNRLALVQPADPG